MREFPKCFVPESEMNHFLDEAIAELYVFDYGSQALEIAESHKASFEIQFQILIAQEDGI